MRIDQWRCRPSCGRHHTTAIMLPIQKSVSDHCTAWASPSTLHWLIHGVATCGCPVTSTISRPLLCGATWAAPLKSADTCVCCTTRCLRRAFADCALSGGISRSRIGKNTCRLKKRRVPRKSQELAGKAGCDQRFDSRLAAAGVRSCVTESAAGLRAPRFLDRADQCFLLKESPSSDRDVSSCVHLCPFRIACL